MIAWDMCRPTARSLLNDVPLAVIDILIKAVVIVMSFYSYTSLGHPLRQSLLAGQHGMKMNLDSKKRLTRQPQRIHGWVGWKRDQDRIFCQKQADRLDPC